MRRWSRSCGRAERFAAEYLKAAIEDTDERECLLVACAGCRARGGRRQGGQGGRGSSGKSLYRALSPRGNPRFSTLVAVTKSMGLTLTVEEPLPQRTIESLGQQRG